MSLKIVSSFFVILCLLLPFKTVGSEDQLKVEKYDDKVVYGIERDKEDRTKKDTEKSLEILKDLRIIIDRRDGHGKGETHNR